MSNHATEEIKPVQYGLSVNLSRDDAVSEKSRYFILNSTEQSIPIEMDHMGKAFSDKGDETLSIIGKKC
jgi:hypothetical protein